MRQIYRAHAPAIAALLQRGFAFRSGDSTYRFAGYGRASELHDALHDVFVAAFEERARLAFDGIRPYAPYLAAIARNVVFRRFRRARREFVRLEEGSAGAEELLERAVEAAPEDPETAALRSEAKALVRAFVAELPDADRKLLELRYREGLSERATAERLGIGRQSVRTRERTLRRALLRRVTDPKDAVGVMLWLGPLLGPLGEFGDAGGRLL